jgi:hypothetical protein
MQGRPLAFSSAPRDRSVVLGDGTARTTLSFDDLTRHTLILGSSGAGKTTRAFNPILAQMLGGLDAGAFILAPKPEVVAEAVEIARRAGREALVVQPGSEVGLDLLSGSPDVDAMYFRDALGRVGDADRHALDGAVARLKNALRMLLGAGRQYYTFEHLSSYCFDDQYAATVRVHAAEHLRTMPPSSEEAWTIKEAINYEDARWFQFAAESRRAMQFAISQLLEPLRDVKIAKTFTHQRNLVEIESVFDGKIIVLHIPRAEYDGAAQVLYTMAKRRFFTAMQRRRANPAFNQTRPVAFALDEYQLCISESDIQSFGIVRSAGCMVLATAHGVSSLYSALPRHHVDAALQNFTQKIFFKTDDHETLALLHRATRHSPGAISPSLLFGMNRDQAMCHLTVGDDSIDAIVPLDPLFLTPDYFSENAREPVRPEPTFVGEERRGSPRRRKDRRAPTSLRIA